MTILKRPGSKLIHEFPNGEKCVGIINFRERIIVATEHRVYELKEDKLYPIQMVLTDVE